MHWVTQNGGITVHTFRWPLLRDICVVAPDCSHKKSDMSSCARNYKSKLERDVQTSTYFHSSAHLAARCGCDRQIGKLQKISTSWEVSFLFFSFFWSRLRYWVHRTKCEWADLLSVEGWVVLMFMGRIGVTGLSGTSQDNIISLLDLSKYLFKSSFTMKDTQNGINKDQNVINWISLYIWLTSFNLNVSCAQNRDLQALLISLKWWIHEQIRFLSKAPLKTRAGGMTTRLAHSAAMSHKSSEAWPRPETSCRGKLTTDPVTASGLGCSFVMD